MGLSKIRHLFVWEIRGSFRSHTISCDVLDPTFSHTTSSYVGGSPPDFRYFFKFWHRFYVLWERRGTARVAIVGICFVALNYTLYELGVFAAPYAVKSPTKGTVSMSLRELRFGSSVTVQPPVVSTHADNLRGEQY